MKYSQENILKKLHSEEVKKHLNKLGINSVLIFGSILTDEFNEESDVDIAILDRNKLNIKTVLNLEIYFEDLLNREIDVVDLKSENLDIFVKINILNNNNIIYSEDNGIMLEKLIDDIEWYYRENEYYFKCRKRDLLC